MHFLEEAVSCFRLYPQLRLRKASSIYESAPWGKTDQPKFLNCVLEIDTIFSSRTLLETIQVIENRLGRNRTEKWGPRTIDLDVLLYGDQIINQPDFIVPHPRMLERFFVMIPMMEIAPDLVHPMAKKTIKELAETLPKEAMPIVGQLEYFANKGKNI